MKTNRINIIAALAAFSLAPLSASAQAQDAPATQAQSAHSLLYAAMESGIDQEQVLSVTAEVVAVQVLASLPPEVLLNNPSVHGELVAALRSPLRQYSERIREEYRPRMVGVIANVMTAEESSSLAEFYSSELGQRVLRSASSNLSVDNMVEDGASDMTVGSEAVEQDMMETGLRAFGALSEEDQADFMRISLTTPGFAKMPALQQQIAPVRAEMESTPPTAEEAAAIQAAVVGVLQQYAP